LVQDDDSASKYSYFMTEDGHLIKADYNIEQGGLNADHVELMLL